MQKPSNKYLLQEFRIAVNKLPFTLPKEVKQEAENKIKAFEEKFETSENEILDALIDVGKKEFPYRRALNELIQIKGETSLVDIVIDHVDESARKKLKTLMDSGADFDEIVSSNIFETDFTPEEKYQIEDAILDAQEHIHGDQPKLVEENRVEYDAFIAKWSETRDRIAEKINELRALADKDPKWRAEILGKVSEFEQGFSIVEPDPDEETVKKEIEYWQGTLGMED